MIIYHDEKLEQNSNFLEFNMERTGKESKERKGQEREGKERNSNFEVTPQQQMCHRQLFLLGFSLLTNSCCVLSPQT